jgi:hypothetical protein
MSEQAEEKKERRPKMVKGKVVRQEGDASLVEWMDKEGFYHRASVPRDVVKITKPGQVACSVDEDELLVGIPYGMPWEELIGEINVTPEMIANELRRSGIWTGQELLMNPDKIRSVMGKVFGVNYSTLLQNVKRYKEESNG